MVFNCCPAIVRNCATVVLLPFGNVTGTDFPLYVTFTVNAVGLGGTGTETGAGLAGPGLAGAGPLGLGGIVYTIVYYLMCHRRNRSR